MITLQKDNVQKIVASQVQAQKLVLAGFMVVENEPLSAKKSLTTAEKKAQAKAEAEAKKAEGGDLDDGAANPTGRNDDGGMQVGA